MRPGDRHGRHFGFSYPMLLVVLALAGVAMAVAAPWWSTELQRAKEHELLRIGQAFARAIESYYMSSPAGVRQFPRELSELLADARFPTVRRHLRRVYVDPFTGASDWVVLRDEAGRLYGVRSASDRTVLSMRPRQVAGQAIEGDRYSDWKFIYVPPGQFRN